MSNVLALAVGLVLGLGLLFLYLWGHAVWKYITRGSHH